MAGILIGCETSGIVRDAFLASGHHAWSCDQLAADRPTNRHIQGDILDIMQNDWELRAVMHPPITRLCNSGVRWLASPPTGRSLDDMWNELDDGVKLLSAIWNVPHIPRVAVENPVMHRHAKERVDNDQPPTQPVQPWHFATGVEAIRSPRWTLQKDTFYKMVRDGLIKKVFPYKAARPVFPAHGSTHCIRRQATFKVGARVGPKLKFRVFHPMLSIGFWCGREDTLGAADCRGATHE